MTSPAPSLDQLMPQQPKRAPRWPWFAAGTAVLVGLTVFGTLALTDREPEPVAVTTAATSPTAAPAPRVPLYTVADTWFGEETPGAGAGATLVVPSGSEADATAAIEQFLREVPPLGNYLWVEVVDQADASTWVCAGEWVGAESGLKYAVFDLTKAFVNFPASMTTCQ